MIRQAYAAQADMLKPQAQQVEQTYAGAADRQAVYAKGFSIGQQLATQKSTAAANDTLTSQGLAPSVTDQGAQASDVLYGLGGYNPASVMNTGAAAFKSAALAAPGAAVNSGNLLSAGALFQGQQNRGALDAQIAQLEAQRPGIVQKNRADLAAQAADQGQQRFENQLALQNQQLAIARFDEDRRQFGMSYALDKIRASQPDLQIVGSDAMGQFAWDKSTRQLVPLIPPVGAGANGKPKLTDKERRELMATAADTAKDAFWGVPEVDKSGKKTGGWLVEPQSYQQAIIDMINRGVPLEIAQRAMNRWWKRPGFDADPEERKNGKIVWDRSVKGAGRPKVPYQQRSGKAGAAAETAAADQRAVAASQLVREYLGTPYVWGGSKPGGFDCSGLLQYVWAKEGVSVPRVTYDQWRAGRSVGKGELAPGDAVFFRMGSRGPEHVGMYIGGGQFIEAPKRGLTVRISNLSGRRDYVGARRFV